MDIDLNSTTVSIQYEKSYVAFLDVLGFKDLVFSKKKADKAKLDQYFGVVNSAIEYLSRIPSKKTIGSIIISDSVIFSVPHGQNIEDNLNRLRHLCVAVGIVQQYLGLKDIWLRGAISSGDTYFDSTKSQIVGPAYINAYLLEESTAIWPRVVVDSKIIEELEFQSASQFINSINRTDNGGLNFSNWGSTILFKWRYPDGKPVTFIDQDVALFIDYLSPIVEENGSSLIKIIKNIESNLYKNATTYKKFRWVADYLRSICERENKNDNVASSEVLSRLDNL
jgi:hypothetical protein